MESSDPFHIPYVGRDAERARLAAAFDDAAAGRSATVTIRGEPGIGKTRLVGALAEHAARHGGLVLIGRCVETVDAPGLWPWCQVVEGYLRATDDVPDALRPYAAPLMEVLPALRDRMGLAERLPHLEPERARFRIFDSVVRFLEVASRHRPLLVALEDVHAADPWSLRLIEFVARECTAARLLLIATYRDLEVAAPLAATLAALTGTARHHEVRLGALPPHDGEALIRCVAGSWAHDAMVAAVLARGDGNPLFILELVRSVLDGRRAEETPDLPLTVRAVIDRRLDGLPAAALETLTVAAAIGREVDVRELEGVTGDTRTALLGHLQPAVERRGIEPVAATLGRYRFAHALVRDRLYERIPAAERPALHRRIGSALEALHAADLDRHLPEIAGHFVRGALAGGAERAVELAARTARAAAGRHAYEEAAHHYRRGLSVWPLLARPDEETRCALLVELGKAELAGGQRDAARTVFADALERARRLRDGGSARGHELFAAAALGLGDMWGEIGVFDAPLVALLDRALAGLEGDHPLRARVLARLAVAYYWTDAVERRDLMSGEAVSIARRLGDGDALAHALYARHFALFGPDRIGEQLALAEEAITEGERRRDDELAMAGRHWRFLDRLRTNDLPAARRDLDEYARLADEVRQPHFQGNALIPRAMFATLEGRFDDAQRLALEALEIGRRNHARNAEQHFGIQMLMLARLQGTEEMALEPARTFVERARGIPAWRAALASLHAALGQRDDAAREVEALLGPGQPPLPRDANLLVSGAMLAEACAVLDHRAAARVLYDRMRPYATHGIVIGIGTGHLGVVAHYLGLLAAVLGRADRADAWFADALQRYEALGARPFVARVLLDRATAASRSRGRVRVEGPRDPVRDLARRAHDLARALGMHRCEGGAAALLASLDTSATTPAGAAAASTPLFRHEGSYWTIVFDGVMTRVRDAKGLHYLHELLRAPGRDVHVAQLLGTTGDLGDAGPLLDARAKREYRRRIAELRAESDDATSAGDPSRALAAHAELDAVVESLATACGLGGRDRIAAAATERARLNVTRAIRGIIRRIAFAHPGLARHLDGSVVTGRFCSYSPAAADRVDWRF